MKTNKAMKRIILFVWVTFLLSCSTASMYDDTKLKDSISNLEARVTKLETLCNQMNSNISALQAVVVALQNKEYIESIKPLPDNQGYSFSFSSGRFVTVYNGKDGKNGTDGKDGKNGIDGKDGENGRDGVDGKDGVTPVIGVRQDTDGVWYWTLNGDWLYVDGKKAKAVGVDGQDGADGKDGVTPKLKIEEGMWYMSCDDGVSWKQLGRATGDDGADAGIISVTEDNGYVHFGMSDGTVITIAKRMPLTISFDSEDVSITTGGASRTIGYTLTGASEKVVVKTLTQDGWKAKVNQESLASGTIEITAPNPLVESEILVFVSDGGQTALAAINCVKATIVISQEKYEVDAAGGNIDVTAQTNTEFQVSIPDDAKSWLSYVLTKSMAKKTFSLSAAANDNAFRRNAVVSLTDDSGNVIRSFVVSQAGDMSGLISIQCDVKGDLHSILESYDKENIVKMKISGVLNDVDFLDIYYEMPALRYLDISDVNIDALPKDSFKSSKNVTTVILPKTLTTIQVSCFEFSNISRVVIPASCETIGASAFRCSSLESIEFEQGSRLKSFPDCMFEYCTSLTSIIIPASCEEIGGSAFLNCRSLESVVFESSSRLNVIRTSAYNGCTALKSIVIPASCKTIERSAFLDCSSLKSVAFESGSQLKNIQGSYRCEYDSSHKLYYYSCGAFSNCIALESIIIPASCEDIGCAAFKNCGSLRRVVFEPGSRLKIISGNVVYYQTSSYSSNSSYSSYSAGAFSDCTALSSIRIPASCEAIEDSAFGNCSSLKSVVFESGSQLKIIKGSAFSTDNPDGRHYYFCSGAFKGCTSLESIIIPASCEIIENAAFHNCYSLKSVAFEPGSRLKTIAGGRDPYYDYGFGAFAGCVALKSITIPASCESIETSAFENCRSLTDLSFESASRIQTIGEYAFTNCSLLHRIYMHNCSELKTIGSCALYGNDQIYFFQIGATTPPDLGSCVFGSVGVYSVLKVPAGSESAYKNASGWNEFSSITAID